MKKTLKLYAADILYNPSTEDKIRSALVIGEYTKLIENSSFDQAKFENLSRTYAPLEQKLLASHYPQIMPEAPARESTLVLQVASDKKIPPAASGREWVFNLLTSTYIDVEINALEISASLFLLADEMELEFYKDFGSHMADEARHAQQIHQLMKSEFSDFEMKSTYTNRVWNKSLQGKTILEKIIIENVIEEGSAADRTVQLISELEAGGFHQVARVFRQINDDEIRHASFGNKWAMRILNNNENDYFLLFDKFSQLINPEARRIDSLPTRRASGFSKSFIKRYF